VTELPGRSRLGDLPYDEWDFEALADIAPGMKPPDLSVVAFFAHHPELAARWLPWNRFINSKACELDRRTREIVIVRVAVRKRSRYEWTQHAKAARAAGLTEEEIDAISSGTATGLAIPSNGVQGNGQAHGFDPRGGNGDEPGPSGDA